MSRATFVAGLALAALAGLAPGCVPGDSPDAADAPAAADFAGNRLVETALATPFGQAAAAPGADTPDAVAATQAEVDASRRTAVVRAAERVAPAVVSVHVSRRERAQPRDLWESFFFPPYEREVPGLGSGFIIRDDGLVLTNEHVVRGAERVAVALADGRELDAEILGVDEVNDLALLRLRAPPGTSIPVAPLGSSDDLLIGEWVVAIGNPFGLLLSNPEPTVTVGVVSGVGRNIIPDGGEERGYYLDMIQTDASINPGNSGGPLVNVLGEVVGVNSSIISRSGGSQGLGFAIPIDRAQRIAADLLEAGRVRRAWIGLDVETVASAEPARRRQVRVSYVAPGSPAADAGIRQGMVLEQVNGRPMRTPLDWEARLLDARVGEALRVEAHDGRASRTFTIVPSDLPSMTAERIRALADFELITLTPAIRAERGYRNERGAVIVDLSAAVRRQLRLQPGDLIFQINREPIRSAEEAAALLRQLAGRGPVRMFVERDGREFWTQFVIGT